MRSRPCQIINEIFDSWKNVDSTDIAEIRDIVFEKKNVGPAGLNEDGLVTLAGEIFQEMMYLYDRLHIKRTPKIADEEIWYISEWFKNNRTEDYLVASSSTRELASFIGSKVYWVAGENGDIKKDLDGIIDGDGLSIN